MTEREIRLKQIIEGAYVMFLFSQRKVKIINEELFICDDEVWTSVNDWSYATRWWDETKEWYTEYAADRS